LVRQVRKPSAQTIAVVCALADNRARWCHGYELCRRLDLKAGTVYPILMRLAERGQVETAWETNPPSGRPARHQYRLSQAGVEFAEALRTPAGTQVSRARSARSRRPALGEAV
jgi:PadR family transcriptional regulator, regulatory protein PadR